LVENILKVKLMSVQLPPNARVRLNRGRAILTVPNCYRLWLSVREANGPFAASKLLFLMPAFVVAQHEPHARTLMLTQGCDLRFNQVVFKRSIDAILVQVNRLLAAASLLPVDHLLQRTLAIFDFQRLWIEARRLALSTTPDSLDFRCRPATPSQLVCEFWQSPAETVQLSLRGLSVDVLVEEQVVANARGRRLEAIIAEAIHSAAVKRLKVLLERFQSEGARNCTVCETAGVPFLKICNERIVCTHNGGAFRIVGSSDPFPQRARDFAALIRRLTIAEEIRVKEKGPIKW
jgi:hypothetical protein